MCGPGLEPHRWARAPGRESDSGLSQGLSLWDLVRFDAKMNACCFNTHVRLTGATVEMSMWKELQTARDTISVYLPLLLVL